MSHRWKITAIVVTVAAIVSTPLIWLLGSPDAGQLAGTSAQAATGVAALLWAVLSGPPAPGRARDVARRTGRSEATDGGHAVSRIARAAGSHRAPGNCRGHGRQPAGPVAEGRSQASSATGVRTSEYIQPPCSGAGGQVAMERVYEMTDRTPRHAVVIASSGLDSTAVA
ncbi:hypothetical protein [Streptomyces sp. NPDC049585]|uniref:hypothetical protein n=1 Tax=Streptomyces sp. NPDC049585 TaxID=3155154 RepID=UPI003446AB90